MESTVAVGMTREFLGPLATTKNARVGMSPELRRVFDHLDPVSSLEVAEMTKLYENCQRMVCAAYANEMADACASLSIDGCQQGCRIKTFGLSPISSRTGSRRALHPSQSVLPTIQTCDLPILQHATEFSRRRPAEIIHRLVVALERKRPSPGSRGLLANGNFPVLVVGVAFKRGQNALHNSPGTAAIQSLLQDYHHIDVEFADPLVEQEALFDVQKMDTSVNRTKTYLEKFDGILVTMDQVGLDMNLLKLLEGVVDGN